MLCISRTRHNKICQEVMLQEKSRIRISQYPRAAAATLQYYPIRSSAVVVCSCRTKQTCQLPSKQTIHRSVHRQRSIRSGNMGGLFSKSKPKHSRVTEQDKAVLQLKNQRDRLKQYQKKVHNNLEKERGVAKQLLKDGKKEKAKLLLRRKKFLEGLLEKTDAQLDNIDKLTHDLEFAQVEQEVVKGLAAGNDALKKMHQIMSIEDVEKIMDDTRESIEYQREIDELLSGGLTAEDESEVLAELDAIVKESMPEVPAAEEEEEGTKINLPDVPKDTIGEPAKEKQKKQADAPLLAS